MASVVKKRKPKGARAIHYQEKAHRDCKESHRIALGKKAISISPV